MPDCKPDNDPCDVMPLAGETWSICLPFGGRIWADGNGVHARGGAAPPDGVYGKVVISNGCIVGLEPEDVPLYTGSPCAPLPGNCGGSSSVNAVALHDMAEPVVMCEIAGGDGVTITGSGTDDDPYIVSAETGVYLRSVNSAISVTGQGTRQNPFTLKHKEGLATIINGMVFDAFGHLTSANPEASAATKGLKGIIPGFGIKVNTDNSTGLSHVGLQEQVSSVPGDYQLGGFDVSLDKAGRVSSIQRAVRIPDAPLTATCGTTDLTINQFGVITAVAETMNLGAGYLASWEALDSTQHVAQFIMRCNSSLAGICFFDKDEDVAVRIDGQKCDNIGRLFWGSGVFMAGQHTLEISGGAGRMAVLLVAVSMMERAW